MRYHVKNLAFKFGQPNVATMELARYGDKACKYRKVKFTYDRADDMLNDMLGKLYDREYRIEDGEMIQASNVICRLSSYSTYRALVSSEEDILRRERYIRDMRNLILAGIDYSVSTIKKVSEGTTRYINIHYPYLATNEDKPVYCNIRCLPRAAQPAEYTLTNLKGQSISFEIRNRANATTKELQQVVDRYKYLGDRDKIIQAVLKSTIRDWDSLLTGEKEGIKAEINDCIGLTK